MANILDTNIKFLKGVGEARASILEKELGIRTFRDLLYYFPIRHLDRSRFYRISEFQPEMGQVQVKGRFIKFETQGEGARKRLVGLFHDGFSVMEVVWFRRISTLKSAYIPGKEYVLFAKPQFFNRAWSMVHPEIESPDQNNQNGFRGIYSLTEKARNSGITSKLLHTLVENLKNKVGNIPETLPLEIVERYRLMSGTEAIYSMHIPSDSKTLSAARERMKFE